MSKRCSLWKRRINSSKRVVTSTVKIKNALDHRCPVKTETAIPKELNFKLMEELKKVELTAPVKRGDIVLENIFNTGVNVVVTKEYVVLFQSITMRLEGII